MTGSAQQKSAWERLPDPKKLREWKELNAAAPERILKEVEAESKHVRRMAVLRLWSAIAVFFASLGATVFLAQAGLTWPATSAAGSGAVFVSVTLITGRAPRMPGIGRGQA